MIAAAIGFVVGVFVGGYLQYKYGTSVEKKGSAVVSAIIK